MKVIHIASGDLWAGAEVQLYHLARELANSREINLVVVLLNEGQLANELRGLGLKVVVFDESCLSALSILSKLFGLVSEFKPNLIHTHRSKENVLGGLIAFITRVPSVRTVHGADESMGNKFKFKKFVFKLLDRIAGRYFQMKMIAVSEELYSKLEIIYPKRKISVIQNGIDIQDVIEKSNTPIDFSCKNEQFNIAFVGRFVSVKRPGMFLEIAIDVIQKSNNQAIQFFMFGDGPLWEEMNQKIIDGGYQEQIHAMGFVNDMAPYLKKMNLLLFTSEHEGLPMTLLEAVALKVPVLSCELPTIKQVLCHGECGYVLESGEIADFSETIRRLYEDRDELRKKQIMAFSNLQARYSIQETARKYMELYRQVL